MVEIDTIRILLEADVIVVCVGGGGIPVVADGSGLRGVEAVVDKDLSAALLAQQLDADTLVLVTDVDAVQAGWGTPEAYPIRHAHPEQLRDLQFAAGSMAPKVEAACRFVEATSHAAVIGSLDQIGKLVTQSAGTIVTGESTIPTEGHLMFSKIVVALDGRPIRCRRSSTQSACPQTKLRESMSFMCVNCWSDAASGASR